MARTSRGHDALYVVGDQIVERCFRRGDSLFTPGTAIWTAENLDRLHGVFVDQPDESSDDFFTKLREQMRGQPDTLVQLMAEVLYVYLHGVDHMIGPEKKRETILRVLGWMNHPVKIPDELDGALEAGYCSPGSAFNMHRYWWLVFIIRFARKWWSESSDARRSLLDDPWAFKTFLWSVEPYAAQSIRNLLLHVFHPDTFEHIASDKNKRAIAGAFAGLLPDAQESDVDRKLLDIRQALVADRGEAFHFYESDLKAVWSPASVDAEDQDEDGEEEPTPGPTLRVWKIAPGQGAKQWDQWKAGGFAALGWDALGDLREVTEDDWPGHVEEYMKKGSDRKVGGPKMVKRFFDRVRIDDILVANRGRTEVMGIGVVTGEYFFDHEAEMFKHRRAVRWLPIEPFPIELPKWTRTFHRIKGPLAETFAEKAAQHGGIGVTDPLPDNTPATNDAAVYARLSQRLLFPTETLESWAAMLEHKRQMVFYGPPGTGKTYAARQFATTFAGDADRVELVQFHPSYGYEDFVEGYRPRANKDGFHRVPGPLLRLAERARASEDRRFVLVIDEINRGNLARVFGELFFLLEYRDELATLQYSDGERFALPKNLYLLGTMNTADRSVAVFDAALRRRFLFVAMYPDQVPVAGLLERFLQLHRPEMAWVSSLLETANKKLREQSGRDVLIGPSYFLDKGLDDTRVRWAWEHTVLPYLADQLGDEASVLAEFGFEAMRNGKADIPNTTTLSAEPVASEAVDADD